MTRAAAFTSVKKAIQVLKSLQGPPDGLTMTEIHEKTGLQKSDVSRLLNLLSDEGVVFRDERSRRFTLSLEVYQAGVHAFHGNSALAYAQKYLDRLQQKLPLVLYMAALDGAEVVILEVRPGKHPVQIMVPVGARLPAYSSASGKAMLSKLPVSEVEGLFATTQLEPVTEDTITSIPALLKDLETVRARGFATSVGENLPGVVGVSVTLPILIQGKPTAIAAALPLADAGEEAINQIGQTLLSM